MKLTHLILSEENLDHVVKVYDNKISEALNEAIQKNLITTEYPDDFEIYELEEIGYSIDENRATLDIPYTPPTAMLEDREFMRQSDYGEQYDTQEDWCKCDKIDEELKFMHELATSRSIEDCEAGMTLQEHIAEFLGSHKVFYSRSLSFKYEIRALSIKLT